ncbi:MAG: hypothetical protein WC667_05120 [Sulfurimonas sp.]|jgi:hypothetical protein
MELKKDTSFELISKIRLAQDVSYWLKRSIEELEKRDINKVLNDIELLHEIFLMKLNEIMNNNKIIERDT